MSRPATQWGLTITGAQNNRRKKPVGCWSGTTGGNRTNTTMVDDLTRGIIIRVQHGKENPYTVVANAIMKDPKLTFRALGVLCYLLSKPDNWTVRLGELVKAKGEGRAAIKSAVALLKQLGYLEVKQRRLRGRFMYVWIVWETPQVREQTCQQPHLFERMLEKVAPGSTPEEKRKAADAPQADAPLFEDAPRSKIDPGGDATVDQKTVNGKPTNGNPSTENRPLVNTHPPTPEEQINEHSAGGDLHREGEGEGQATEVATWLHRIGWRSGTAPARLAVMLSREPQRAIEARQIYQRKAAEIAKAGGTVRSPAGLFNRCWAEAGGEAPPDRPRRSPPPAGQLPRLQATIRERMASR